MNTYARLAVIIWMGLGTAPATGVQGAGADSARSTTGSAIEQSAASDSAEAKLAERFAPIAQFKRRERSHCGPATVPYLPVPVDVVLGDPDVVLRHDSGKSDNADDPVVAWAPSSQVVAGMGSEYYLDLPGDQRNPLCDYEHYAAARMDTRSPLVYAHVATEAGHRGLALQYWFFYVFDQFANTHEGDWEMIQLTFDAPTAAAALTTEPVSVAYAQHEGGEVAAWDDPKLRKEGDHPIVYPAAGPHAAYFGSHLYLGWRDQGAGFGCDDTTDASVRVPLGVQVVPHRPDPSGPFGWLTFQGGWGAKDGWVFDGPSGPSMGQKWVEPFSWQAGLRTSSLALPVRRTVGPNPTGLFCGAVGIAGSLWTIQKDHAWLTYGAIGFLLMIPTALIVLNRRLLGAALMLYAHHAGAFLAVGAVLLGLGLVANIVEGWVRAIPLGGTLFTGMNLISPAQLLVHGGSALQQFVGWTLVTPAAIFVVVEIQAGRRPLVLNAYRAALARFTPLVAATARATLTSALLIFSILGVPWGLRNAVRAVFVPQVVLLEGANWRQARWESAQAVSGRWWRTAALMAIVGIALFMLAPTVGLLMLVFVTPSIVLADVVSGAVYAVLFPLVGIATTLWYQQHHERVTARSGHSIWGRKARIPAVSRTT